MTKPTVLLVEDEPAQREVLAYNLAAEGFAVLTAATGGEAELIVAETPPDVILLDWMLPEVSGIELCRRFKTRPETRAIPVVMLSARGEEVDRVRGLETGADDYVVKPYSMVELMARLRVQLRRVRPTTVGQVLEHGDLRLDTESHRVHRGRVFSREALLDRVWGRDIYVETRTVDVHVGRLRKALTEAGGEDPIRTVRGSGYSLG